MKKLISVIIPANNEEKNIVLIYQAIIDQFKQMIDLFDYEIIFINDGSTDNSRLEINKITKLDTNVKSLDFSRNFGKEMATTAGLNNCKGDAVLIIDADLQHPPELIPEFIKKWQAGAEMVIGVRKKKKMKNLIKEAFAMLFYESISILGESYFISRATDYRLIDRKVVDEFNRFTEHNRITRGLLDWLGFEKEYVYFEANKRKNGKASYSSSKLIKLAISTFVSHSLFPLKLAGYLGIFIIMFSGPLGFYIFIDRYITNNPFGFSFTGTAILAVLNMFLVGIILSCLGLIALYIGDIQHEVMNRPMYIVREKKNFKKEDK